MKYVLILLCLWVTVAKSEDSPLVRPQASTVKSGDSEKSLTHAPSFKEAAEKAKSEKKEEEDGPTPYIAAVETYGSDRLNSVLLKDFLGKDLQNWIEKGLEGDPASLEMEAALVDKIKKEFGFATVDWSIVQYFQPTDMAIYITLDLVEKKDVATRMPFEAEPKGKYSDPGGLIQEWMAYETLALELFEVGQIEPESEECVAFHCPFAHKHPKLKKYGPIFEKGVPKFEKELSQIQNHDARPEYRAAATFLLAYLKDGKRVVKHMESRLKDPNPLVRNNALRVLGDISEFHPELIISLRPLLRALEYPRVSDRSKAIYVIHSIARNSSKSRAEILQLGVPGLVKMVHSKQPDHRELAHGVLRMISGKDFGMDDALSWKNWAKQLRRDQTGEVAVRKKSSLKGPKPLK